jgi:hypothetical protein
MAVTINGSASVTINSGAVLGITSGTAVASTSGTSIDFTSIPSWVKRITVMFSGVSTNGTSLVIVQIGYQSPVTTTGYVSGAVAAQNGAVSSGAATSTAGFLATAAINTAAGLATGTVTIVNFNSNAWVASSVVAQTDGTRGTVGGGSVTLGGTLDRVRITTVNGTDTFDAGSINILYEG